MSARAENSYAGTAKIALVIDDLGYNLESGMRVLNLPGPVTLSLLPFTPKAEALSLLALEAGQDIMLHLPMEAIHNTDHHLENVLELSMSRSKFQDSLLSSLKSLPNCIGVNNHTGSLLTQHRQPMEWLMGTIQNRGLFFLDSRTTAKSVANTIAREWGVPTLKRDIFLDHEINPSAIEQAFNNAIKIAKKQGYAIIIAHPHGQSLDFLERALPQLEQHAVSLVPLRHLISQQHLIASADPSAHSNKGPSAKAELETYHPAEPGLQTGLGSVHTTPGL